MLLKINRECTNDQGKRAIKLLKESCFKVVIKPQILNPGPKSSLFHENTKVARPAHP